ncbi:MAG: YbfB/YjiJ family MFS transporter [Xanthobacteraceae bacterium]
MTTSRHLRGRSSNPALIILSLSLSIAVGLGIGRFAYSLVLPDMRDSLGWSYSTAGFMNTVNAVGYLAGALSASKVVRRIGAFNAVWLGTLICLAALALSALSGNAVPFSLARLALGVGAAFALVGGGALTATIAQANPSRAAVLLSLFYAGPAIGIIASGLVSPFVLVGFGRGSWWLVWVVLSAISAAFALVVWAYRVESPPAPRESVAVGIALRPILAYLAGYFLFGAGYIAYMTFMIAYVRDAGGGALAQSAFWCAIGLGAFVSPWIWRGLLEHGDSGKAMAVLMAMTAIGAALPMAGHGPVLLGASALVFGIAFFAVVTATTAFVRFNYPPAAWPQAIAVMTIAFSLGQTLGPFVTGAITDALGSLFYALVASAGALGVGAAVALGQRPLARTARR